MKSVPQNHSMSAIPNGERMEDGGFDPNPQAAPPRRAGAPSGTRGGTDAVSMIQTVLTTVLLSVGISVLVGIYAYWSRPGSIDRWVLAMALIIPAVSFAATRSSLLLDHFLLIVVINRLLRRLMDWGEGRYDPLPALSLLSLGIAFLMIFNTQQNWYRLPAAMRRAAGLLIGGLSYALVIGFSQYGMQSLYACAEYATPLVVLYYCVSCRPSAGVLRRWLTVLATLGVLAGIYGIIQWAYVPTWDGLWLVWSGMANSMGGPIPYRMSIASTLESRGPAAIFFAVTSSLFIGLPMFRRKGGVLLGVLPVIALLLTTARTGLVYLVLSLLASTFFSRGRGGFGTILSIGIVAIVAVVLLGRQDESTMIFDRVATLGDVQNDGSANVRVDIARQGILITLQNPQGFGFGSGGNAIKAGSTEQDSVGDNGYLEILSTLGLPGTALYFAGLYQIVMLAFRNRFLATGQEAATHLGLGMLVAVVPALVIGNCLITAHAAYVWIILSRHLAVVRPAVSTRGPLDPSKRANSSV